MKTYLVAILMAISPLSIHSNEIQTDALFNTVIDKKQNFEANFSSDIFDQYFEQMAAISQKFKKLPDEFKAVFSHSGETIADKRLTHEKMIKLLRETYQSHNLDSEVLKEVNAMSAALFSEANVKDSYQAFLSQYIDLSDEAINAVSLPQLVLQYYAPLVEIFKNSDHFSEERIKYDYHLQGFLPVRIYSIDGVHHLYTPNPIIKDKISNSTTLNPLFLSYLNHLKKEQKKYLYVSVKSISEELVNLSESEEYKEVFNLIIIDRTTDFYFQKNEWEEKNDAIEFKKNLMKNIFENNTNFYWPTELLEQDWVNKITDIIENVHSKYFQNHLTLTKAERGAFIEIVNAEMIIAACEFFKPDFVNMTCEYTMDRGPSQFAFLYLYDIMQKSGQLTTEEKRDFITLFFVPPMIAHNRTSHDYRVNRLSETIEVLEAQVARTNK